MQLVLDSKELKIERRRNMFYIEAPGSPPRSISPRKVTSIAVTQSVWVSTSAVMLAAEYEIPILYHNNIGKVVARVSGPGFGSIATLRRLQVQYTDTADATRWMIGLYLLKIQHQVSNLQQLGPKNNPVIAQIQAQTAKLESLANTPLNEARQRLMAAEAVAARYYWQALSELLPKEVAFEKRSRMPAEDPFNAALNYLYGMLYGIVEGSLFAVGLDPHLGLLHADEYNKPVLAFDFIEPFRPWLDWLLIQQIRAKAVSAALFKRAGGGVLLDQPGKMFFIPLFNNWLREERLWGGVKRTHRTHIYQLAAQYVRKLRKTDNTHATAAPCYSFVTT